MIKKLCLLFTLLVYCTQGRGETHEYVDLGLSVKWATCNVGASSPQEAGNYYAWGETEAKNTYNWQSYKYSKGYLSTMTKYCNSSSYGTVDNISVLEPSDDVAQVKWGGSWRMPTGAEWAELRTNCIWTWTTQNGKNGYIVSSKSKGNSIFLPAAGYHDGSSVGNAGAYGCYWSASLGSMRSYFALNTYFISYYIFKSYYELRFYGLSVRPVCP